MLDSNKTGRVVGMVEAVNEALSKPALEVKKPRYGTPEWEATRPEREAAWAAGEPERLRLKAEQEAAVAKKKAWQHEQEFRQIVGDKYAGCRLENYVEQPGSKLVTDRLSELARTESAKPVSLVWVGGVGTGKDHMLAAMLRVEHDKGRKIRLDHGSDFAGQCRGQIDSGERESDFFRRFTSPDIWAISDPDGQRATFADFTSDWMLRVVDARVRAGKPTWVTMNVESNDEMSDRLGARIADRLWDGAIVLRCSWPSYRKPAEVIGSPRHSDTTPGRN